MNQKSVTFQQILLTLNFATAGLSVSWGSNSSSGDLADESYRNDKLQKCNCRGFMHKLEGVDVSEYCAQISGYRGTGELRVNLSYILATLSMHTIQH